MQHSYYNCYMYTGGWLKITLKSVGKSIPFKLWQHFKNIYLSLFTSKNTW